MWKGLDGNIDFERVRSTKKTGAKSCEACFGDSNYASLVKEQSLPL